MTNAVDILLVDGPAHGHVVCMKKPLTTNIETLIGGQGVAIYERRVHDHYNEGVLYQVALPPNSEVSDDFIDGTIVACNFQPAWDLR